MRVCKRSGAASEQTVLWVGILGKVFSVCRGGSVASLLYLKPMFHIRQKC